jgi:hypothetical protein
MKINFKSIIFPIAIVAVGAIYSCKKEEEVQKTQNDIDLELYNLAKETTGFVYFNKIDTLLNKSAGSGHPQPYLRTKYNSKAASVLNSEGKIIAKSSFPEGSLIVKELYDNSKKLVRYAILYKDSSNANADTKGWVWGYVNSDGGIAESATKKGSSCISCHSQADNIDYMLMNKYFQ